MDGLCYRSLTAPHRYDFDTQYAFVGDYSGQITLLKLEQNTCSVITTLKGHEGRLRHPPQVFRLIWASEFSSQRCGCANDQFLVVGQISV